MMECLYGTTAVLVRQSLIGPNWQAIRNLRKVADGPFVTDPRCCRSWISFQRKYPDCENGLSCVSPVPKGLFIMELADAAVKYLGQNCLITPLVQWIAWR